MDSGKRTAQVASLIRDAARGVGAAVDLAAAILEYAALLLVWSVLRLLRLILGGPEGGRPGR